MFIKEILNLSEAKSPWGKPKPKHPFTDIVLYEGVPIIAVYDTMNKLLGVVLWYTSEAKGTTKQEKEMGARAWSRMSKGYFPGPPASDEPILKFWEVGGKSEYLEKVDYTNLNTIDDDYILRKTKELKWWR